MFARYPVVEVPLADDIGDKGGGLIGGQAAPVNLVFYAFDDCHFIHLLRY